MTNEIAEQEIEQAFNRLTETCCPKCSRPVSDYAINTFSMCEECYDAMSEVFISFTAIRHVLPMLTILDHIKDGE